VNVLHGDLYEALRGQVDMSPFELIVSNPPYIRSGQIGQLERNVREYEPRQALDGGADGLAVHRRILAQSSERLVAGGRVFLEVAFDQGEAAREMAGEYAELDEIRILRDHGGRDRVLAARRK
jgi:release factor glutamine methyltransferase